MMFGVVCGEVVWRSVSVSLAVLLVVDVVGWGCCSLSYELYGVCVCVFWAEKDDISRSLE